MMSTGFEWLIHIVPTLRSNAQLLKDFKKQLSLLVDLVEDRSEVERQPVFVMFRPSGRLRDEFEDVVHTYIVNTIKCHYDDMILIIAFNNTTVHCIFLEEMRQRFKFVEAITLSNGSIDATSNRITFENLKQILIGEFSFKELSAPGLGRHEESVMGADRPFKTTLTLASDVSPIQVSQPTSNDERKQDSCDSSRIHPTRQEADTNVVSESDCKHLSEVAPDETTEQKSTEDDMNQQDNIHTEIHLKKQETDTNVGIESNLTTQNQQTKRRTSTSFVIEGCIDAQNSPVVFETQTIHDEVAKMRHGDESHQTPIEKRFKLPPGCLLGILKRLQEELDSLKEKKTGNSDLMELSSETFRILERQLKLRSGKLKAVLLALYNLETEQVHNRYRMDCRLM